MTRTPWFKGSQNPAYVGVYERDYKHDCEIDGALYCYWNGRHWYPGGSDPDDAYLWYEHLGPAMKQYLPWRGLTKQTF